MDEILHEARSDRMFPGDGAFGVKNILACLPQDIPYSLEIPGDALAIEIGFEEYARRALQTAKRNLDHEEETTVIARPQALRHCEEHSDAAVHAGLDCRAALAMTSLN
jgi:hypothetical protein